MWQKSSRCDNNLCVEVLTEPGRVSVRSNRHPEDILKFGANDWRQFLADLPARSRS